MDEKYFKQLYEKYLKDELGKIELIIFSNTLNSDEGARLLETCFEENTQNGEKFGIYPDKKPELLKAIKSQINFNKPSRKNFYLQFLKYAAILLIPLCIAWTYIHLNIPLSGRKMETVQVIGQHSHSQITLSDGTKVFLSANSTLSYPKQFAGKSREVALNGEGFFEVTKDSGKPFLIKTERQTIRVLGTSLNVRARTDEPEVVTTLIEGSVELLSKEQKILLKPGEQAIFTKDSEKLTVKDMNVEMFMSWKTGKYIFNNQSFEEIVKILEKGFDVEIRIKNETLKKRLYTMRFEHGEPLEKIFNLISVEGKFKYYYVNGELIIE